MPPHRAAVDHSRSCTVSLEVAFCTIFVPGLEYVRSVDLSSSVQILLLMYALRSDGVFGSAFRISNFVFDAQTRVDSC